VIKLLNWNEARCSVINSFETSSATLPKQSSGFNEKGGYHIMAGYRNLFILLIATALLLSACQNISVNAGKTTPNGDDNMREQVTDVTITIMEDPARKVVITDVPAINELRQYLARTTKSDEQLRGMAYYFVDFHDGYAVGLYKDLSYGYVGETVEIREQDSGASMTILSNSDRVGYNFAKEGYEFVQKLAND
jgi:hypothetical protein